MLEIKIALGILVALVGFGLLIFGKFGKRRKPKIPKTRRKLKKSRS